MYQDQALTVLDFDGHSSSMHEASAAVRRHCPYTSCTRPAAHRLNFIQGPRPVRELMIVTTFGLHVVMTIKQTSSLRATRELHINTCTRP